MIFENILKSNFVRNIRNNLNIKPTIILKPNNITSPISDFFYWENNNDFKTKFFIFNLATHAIPEEESKLIECLLLKTDLTQPMVLVLKTQILCLETTTM